VMATPAIRALREHFEAARVVGVCRSYVAQVLEGSDWLDEVIHFDRKGPASARWPAVAWKLRRENIGLAVLFPNSFRSAWVAWLAGARARIGFDRYCRGKLLTSRLEPKRNREGRLEPSPIIDDYNRLAQAAGCSWPGHRMELRTTRVDESAADRVCDKFRFNGSDELICLNPGAAFGSAKQWDVEQFAELAQHLTDQRRGKVLVLCGPKERDVAREIVRLAARPMIHTLAEEPLSIGLTKALVRRCDLLITTDSGPRHFAAAFDRPVVTLFGPTHIEWTETYYAKAIHLQKKVFCGPCQLRMCPLDHRCMALLSAFEVFTAVNDLMAHGQRKAS
jgi:heptosyltransferase-2